MSEIVRNFKDCLAFYKEKHKLTDEFVVKQLNIYSADLEEVSDWEFTDTTISRTLFSILMYFGNDAGICVNTDFMREVIEDYFNFHNLPIPQQAGINLHP